MEREPRDSRSQEARRDRSKRRSRPAEAQDPRSRAQPRQGALDTQDPRSRAQPRQGAPEAEYARGGLQRPDRIGRERTDLTSMESRLIEVRDLIDDAHRRLRPGRPVAEVPDDDIVAARVDLSQAVPITIELLEERVGLSAGSRAEAESNQVLSELKEIRDLVRGDQIPRDPELRERLVKGLRAIAAAIATALVGIILQAVLDALGVSDALSHATAHGAMIRTCGWPSGGEVTWRGAPPRG
jgi:hypothetical protein